MEAALKIRSRDFETVQNIEDEKQKELFKTVTDPTGDLIANGKSSINDWTFKDNNTTKK